MHSPSNPAAILPPQRCLHIPMTTYALQYCMQWHYNPMQYLLSNLLASTQPINDLTANRLHRKAVSLMYTTYSAGPTYFREGEAAPKLRHCPDWHHPINHVPAVHSWQDACCCSFPCKHCTVVAGHHCIKKPICQCEAVSN